MTTSATGESLVSLLAFLMEIDKLKLIERRSYIAGAARRENSAEHSWHVAIAAWLLARQAGAEVDQHRLLQLALAHDLGEIDARDVPVYAVAARKDRTSAEAACVERLRQFAPELLAELPELWLEYEEQRTIESQWVKVADRVLPFLHNFASEGKLWREQDVRRRQALGVQQAVARTHPSLYAWIEARASEAVARGWLRGDDSGNDSEVVAPAAVGSKRWLNELAPLVLQGREVTLRALELADAPALAEAAAESRDHYQFTPVPGTLAEAIAYVETALVMRNEGVRFAFAVLWRGRVIGSTSLWDFLALQWPAGSSLANSHGPDVLEIGHTWLASSAQRTVCNTEAKYLLLRFAFETWHVHRVRLRTDERNQRSRRAIERIGARFDGIVRGDRVANDGSLRHSAYYSLLRDEWSATSAELLRKLGEWS